MTDTPFREVRLSLVSGRLFLHSMPGRAEALDEFLARAKTAGVKRIVCLASMAELRQKSPAYALAAARGLPRFEWRELPVADFGVPADAAGFRQAARDAAGWLREGEGVLVHCGAGIGRTGMFAACVLIGLGLSEAEADTRVSAAGSGPETSEQQAIVSEMAREQHRRQAGKV